MHKLMYMTLSKMAYVTVKQPMRMLLVLYLIHMSVSYVLMVAAGEYALTATLSDFFYFYNVVGSTVGFGDMSPTTEAGKLVFVLWMAPGTLSIFMAVLTRLVLAITGLTRSISMGNGNFEFMSGHVVVLCDKPEDAEKLFREYKASKPKAGAVWVTTLPEDNRGEVTKNLKVDVVKSPRLQNKDGLRRAGALRAATVIVSADNDFEATQCCMAISSIRTSRLPTVAKFEDPSSIEALEHLEGFEFVDVTSSDVAMLASAAANPGSSKLLTRLLTHSEGSTLRSTQLSRQYTVSDVDYTVMRRGGNFFGVEETMTPDPQDVLCAGATVFYVAPHEIKL